jgi:(p)ppGpp synthase/HD superfamily hydrolase
MKALSPIVTKALRFATDAHNGQVRKYTGEPYINHPVAVSKLVMSVTNNQHMIAAALLHDTVEDTPVTLRDIRREFGGLIETWVEDLTDISRPENGNRTVRKLIDLRHTARALPLAKTIKLADLIDNTNSIVSHDPKFAPIYMREKKALLAVLTLGDKILYMQAQKLVNDFYSREEKL